MLTNTPPTGGPLADVCAFVGNSFYYNVAEHFTDAEGHDLVITSNPTGLTTFGTDYKEGYNEVSGTITTIWNLGNPYTYTFSISDGYDPAISATLNILTRYKMYPVDPTLTATVVNTTHCSTSWD